MSALTREDFPLSEWCEHDTACCPRCGGKVELCRYLEAKPIGSFSLAGAQMKFSARELWKFRCNACGCNGRSELK